MQVYKDTVKDSAERCLVSQNTGFFYFILFGITAILLYLISQNDNMVRTV